MAPPKWGQFAQINPWRTAGCIVGTALAALMSRLIAHFVYLWETNFPPDAYVSFSVWRKEKKNQQQQHNFHSPIEGTLSHQPPPPKKSIKHRPPVIDGAVFPAVAGWERFHHRILAPWPKNHHRRAVWSLRARFNGGSSYDPEARCHWLLNNILEASGGHCGNYLYVSPLKDMSTHGTSRQPSP